MCKSLHGAVQSVDWGNRHAAEASLQAGDMTYTSNTSLLPTIHSICQRKIDARRVFRNAPTGESNEGGRKLELQSPYIFSLPNTLTRTHSRT